MVTLDEFGKRFNSSGAGPNRSTPVFTEKLNLRLMNVSSKLLRLSNEHVVCITLKQYERKLLTFSLHIGTCRCLYNAAIHQ